MMKLTSMLWSKCRRTWGFNHGDPWDIIGLKKMYFLFYPKPWYEEVAGIILQMSIPDITILNWQISFRSAETISCGAVGGQTTNNLSLNDEFIMQLSPNEIKPYICLTDCTITKNVQDVMITYCCKTGNANHRSKPLETRPRWDLRTPGFFF